MLRNFSGLARMWKTIEIYEMATAAKVNVTKTEGLRLGSLKAKDYDEEAETGKGADIKWCKRGEYIISLGVPIGWDHSEEEFWWTKYRKCKSYIAHWHDVERMSPYGKSLLANACVYGRFRYWAMCMRMPSIISQAITSDVQAHAIHKNDRRSPPLMTIERSLLTASTVHR